MSLGGFKALAKITRSRLNCGYDEHGIPFISATMELEGKLLEFNYGNLEGDKLLSKKNTKVYIDIVFEEEQRIDKEYSTSEMQYIGDIRYNVNEEPLCDSNEPTVVNICITLSYSVFPQLLSMEGRNIVIQTIHDLVTNPNEKQKLNHIAALINQIYDFVD